MPKLVKFSNGTYGVRVGAWWYGYKFLDLTTRSVLSWDTNSAYFGDCQGSRDEAETYLERSKKPLYTVVKD